ncbi:MAG TPA: ATP-binding protein [Actinomycetota bacterium]|nr:ATP-binding protein [Actinomycetota bacterium]
MHLPARALAGNLVWTRYGGVWAVFAVEPAVYAWLSRHDQLDLHRRTRAALVSTGGETLLLSLCAPLAPAELTARMSAGAVPLDAWRTLCRLAGEAACDLDPTERHLFLAAELPAGPVAWTARSVAGSTIAGFAGAFGLPPGPVRAGERARRGEQADHLRRRLELLLPVRPATAGEVAWIYRSALLRGLGQPAPQPDVPAVGGPALVALADALLQEGGDPADVDRPRHRRYLRVETEAGVAYQALLALSGMPHRFTFPGGGGEWLVAAEQCPFPVDWGVRIRPVPNQAAQATARRQARQLRSQVGEYAGDPAGAPPGLADAIDDLGHLRAELAANPADAELRVTTAFAVSAPTLARLEERAAALQARYAAGEYQLHRPTGGQLGLLTALLPGSPLRTPATDYVHHLLAGDLAAGMPFGAADLGDPQGMLLGYCPDAGTFRPVLFDPAYGPSVNRSGSLGAFGALGSGKSYFAKLAVHATLARGGQVVVLDRTPSAEYARLAPVLPGRAQVVSLARAGGVCLDPLTAFAGEDRVSVTLAFLTLVTGAAPGGLQGLALAEAVEKVAARRDGNLDGVLEELERAAPADPHAEQAWRILRHARRNPLARFAFGPGDPVALDADYLVFHAPGLSLPDREVALREHLAQHLLPDQVLSQALLYLVAAVARAVAFADPRRFGAALFDEAWCLTSSLQGRALLLDGIRDGRKHNAAIWLLSQHPDDLGDDQLAHLLGPRFAFRQSAQAAPAALHFVGVEPSDEAVGFLTAAPEGACFFRDVRDRVGRLQVLASMIPELHAAFDTNPVAQVPAAGPGAA